MRTILFAYYICIILSVVTWRSCTASGMSEHRNINSDRLYFNTPVADFEQIEINLYSSNGNTPEYLLDGVMAQYDPSFSNSVNGQDAVKFSNINESFALSRDGKLLTIERRQIIGVTDTLFLDLKNTVARDYQFQFIPKDLAHPCLSALLEDSYLLTSTPIDLNDTSTISFTVTSVAGSKAANRFRIVFKPGIVWSGALNSDWFTPGNWASNIMPSATCNDVLIPNTTNKPIVAAGVVTVKNITIQTGAVLTIDNATLQVGAVITNTGSLKTYNGTIEMNGTKAQTIVAGTFQNNDVKNLVISNTSSTGVTLNGPLNLYGTLSFGNHDNQKLVSAGNLNLRSTITGTARIADVTNNGINTGNIIRGDVVVERYYPARRAWRLITAPVSTKRSIFNSWQVGGGNTTDLVKPAPANSGTYITSPTGLNGLDLSQHFSLDSFSVSMGKLVGINDTKNNKFSDSTNNPGTRMDNKGYFIFVRGDRTPSNIDANPTHTNITTLRDTGAMQTGTKIFSRNLISPHLYMLIGNPYASPVDFGKLTRTNIQKKFWAWDPRINNTLGGYVFVDGQTTPPGYIITPDDPEVITGQNQHIQSGQAFFVQASAPGTALITFDENDKSDVDNNTVFRPSSPAQAYDTYESLRANLYLADSNSATLADGVYIQYNNNFSSDIDSLDAIKFTNILENFGIAVDGQTLTLERRPLVKDNDTIFFKLWNTTARNYQFRFSTSGLNHPGLEGYLEDNYLKTRTPIDLNGYTNIDFSVTADAASKAINRFLIIFKTVEGGPLPVTFTSVKAYQQASNINVEWTVENEINTKGYEVEKSSDGINFTKLAASIALHNNGTTVTYTIPDASPLNGVNYYRIKSISKTGEVKYSSVVKITIGNGMPEIAIYPNPVVSGTINLQLINQPKGSYRARLINKLGQALITKEITHQEGSSSEILQMNKAMSHGTYHLEVTSPSGKKTIINLLY